MASRPAPTSTSVQTAVPATPGEIPSVGTMTSIALPSPTLTEASMPIAAQTPVIVPTMLTPTLSSKQVQNEIGNLFENNAGCLLPCFWGITPGQTEWQTAQQLLEPLALRMYVRDGYAEVVLPAPRGDDLENLIELRQFYEIEDGVISWIISPVVQTSNFHPSTILSKFGPPEEVLLLTANASREGYWRSFLTLFYPQHGFVLQYGADNTRQDDRVRSCGFEQDFFILLGSWPSEEEVTLETISNRRILINEIVFDLPLEEATGISVETFYETFKDPTHPICLETPLNLWPGP